MSAPHAVILGMTGVNPLGTIRSLGREGIPVVGMHIEGTDADAARSKYLEEPVRRVEGEEELLRELLSFAGKQKEKSVLFPTGDEYIVFCSRNFEILQEGFHVPHATNGKLEGLLDKNANNNMGRGTGFRVPWSGYLSTFTGREIDGPVIVKPVNSVGSSKRDMCVYNSGGEAAGRRQELIDKHGEMVVQEFIPGGNRDLVEVHAYGDSSRVIISGMQRNLFSRRMNKGVYGGVVFESIWLPELIDPSKRLMERLVFNGPVDINLKRSDLNGKYYFMEVNPRTSANLSLDTETCVNLPAVVYTDLTGGNSSRLLGKQQEEGVMWLWETSLDKYIRQGGSGRELLNTLRGKKILPAIYDPEDPDPFNDEGFTEETKYILKELDIK